MAQIGGSQRFDGNGTIVTGSTRGIGASIAKRFAAEGASVVATGRTREDGEAVVADIRSAGGEATFVEADVRDPDEIRSLIDTTVDAYGGLTTLVNNAAVQTETTVTEASIDDWDRVLETDFRSYWLCAKHAAEIMDGGSIVNVSSNHAMQTMPSHFPYNAVKSGIDGLTRAMALDLGPDIRVNTVNPGWIDVERTTAEMSPAERRELEAIHPAGRIGTPADVAGAVAFLASEDAAFVTGASLLVDGGRASVLQDNVLPDYAGKRDGER